ncbi:myb-related transcription factor, partner of profilin-like [Pseudophryne corroboree]|uniref:myb-related transcription factor, partner of profilin-like n=1 Tax=Pseudophryne corroboree TaxID=495146 RepID=UPI00308163C4
MKITEFFSFSTSSSGKAKRTVTPITDNTEEKDQSMFQSGISVCTTIQTPKKRKERFTDPELHILVDTILAHAEQLFGRKSLNASGKAALWDIVVKKVNEVAGMKRTVVECKKRWHDYKRKVQQCIDKRKLQVPLPGKMESLEDYLSKRQINVAMFFKMDAEGTGAIQVSDDSSTDDGDCASSSHNVVTPSTHIHSEDEFIGQTEKQSLSACSVKNSPQDGSISQSNKAKVSGRSIDHKPSETQLQLTNLETKLDQLITQQKNTNEILQGIRSGVVASLDLQKKMNRLLKSNFLELQNSIRASKEASSNQSSILEITLKGLQAKMDEVTNSLQAKQLQELMSSDESECYSQDMGSSPLAAKTTPAKKKRCNQRPSSTGLIKKKKM